MYVFWFSMEIFLLKSADIYFLEGYAYVRELFDFWMLLISLAESLVS